MSVQIRHWSSEAFLARDARAGGAASGWSCRGGRDGGAAGTGAWTDRLVFACCSPPFQLAELRHHDESGLRSLLCKTQLLHVLRYDFFQESFAQQIVGEHLPSTDQFAARGVEMCSSWDCLVVARRCAAYVIQTFTLEPVIKTQRGLITS